MILVSADFGREITTAVLWLNGFEGMDIRCVRLVPYDMDGKVLLDIQQVIPLPEAEDYQVQLRKKGAARERARRDTRDWTRYHVVVDGEELPDENKRNAVRVMVEQLVQRGVRPSEVAGLLPRSKFLPLEGVIEAPDQVEARFRSAYPQGRPGRYYLQSPFVDVVDQKTYVLSKMWGRTTHVTLATLSESFPQTKVTFREAESDV